MINTAERVYTLLEVADILGLQVRTVRHWVVTGRLPAFKRKPSQGYSWLVREEDLKSFMEVRKDVNKG